MQPTRAAYGAWNGGLFLNYGLTMNENRYLRGIRLAYERGIRTFVTADVYGEGRADTLLGEALSEFPRQSYCLVGAVGHDFYQGKRQGAKGFPRFTDPSLRSPADYADYLRMAAERSLERLQASQFDLLMLHNPDATGYTSEAVWAGMQSLRQAGLTDLLGIAPGPANGYTLDLVGALESFGEVIDWAMIILSPFEPWPGNLCLAAAAKHQVKLMTRVVDHGGIFHDDVKPGHVFGPTDHRKFRPAGWVETGNAKLEAIRPYAVKHGLTPLQLALAWSLAQPAVECVVPTLIQEAGDNARPFEDKIEELAAFHMPGNETALQADEIKSIEVIGNNQGTMWLQGGSSQFQAAVQADQWPLTDHLMQVAQRWGIVPDRDLYCPQDARDLRDKGLPMDGVPQAADHRLYVQLLAYTDCNAALTAAAVEAVKSSGLDAVVYANANDPVGIAVLILTAEPEDLTGKVRSVLGGEPFDRMTPQPELTMLGRTYGFGGEPKLDYWLLQRPVEYATRTDWPWAVWYPLRRNGAFNLLPRGRQMEILKEHRTIGMRFGASSYAGDIRLASFGMDRNDNEFVLGIMGPRLDWLSKLIEQMRSTTMTSQYMESLGPFFIGRAIYQSSSATHPVDQTKGAEVSARMRRRKSS